MIRVVLLVASLLICVSNGAQSQPNVPPEQSEVLAVIDRFMQAVSTNDPAAMSALQLEGVMTTVAGPSPDGSGTRITRRSAGSGSGAPRSGMRRERYWDPTVLVRGSIAVVWTPYEFWRDGKTTHCGIDVFDLVKQDGAWRIASIMYTVEPNACPDLRPADPSRVRPTP
jgi:hypothetical protein